MPLRYLFDEHLRGPLWRAVRRYNLDTDEPLDVVRVGDPPDLPLHADDAEILRWMEREERVLVTFDRSTMPDHLAQHLAQGGRCPGIFLLRTGIPIQHVLEFLVLAAYASEPHEWFDRIEYLPGPRTP